MGKIKGSKTPRVCGYSTRHFRRILRNRINEDMRSIMETENQRLIENRRDPAEIENKISVIKLPDNSFPGTNSNCFEKPTEVSDKFSDTVCLEASITCTYEDSSEHLCAEKQFLHSDLDSECSIFDDEFVWATLEDSITNSYSDVNCEALEDAVQDEVVGNDYCHFDLENDLEKREKLKKETLKSSLRFWAIAFRVSLAALTALLLILRCFTHADLPLDGRSLLGTPKHTLIFEIGGGQYYHFELRKALQGILRDHKRRGKQTEHVKLLVNIDGFR